MKIGELAKRTGCQTVTIRFYEKEGLLPRPERSDGNYRLYNQADLERLDFIIHCRKHGMKLDDIRRLLHFRDQPEQDCSWVHELISGHIKDIQAQIDSLEHLKQHLEQINQLATTPHDGLHCGIMHSLAHKELCCAVCTCAQNQKLTPLSQP